MVHLAYDSDAALLLLLFLLFARFAAVVEVKLGLGNQLVLVDVIVIMIQPQRVIPLSRVQRQIVQENAPYKRPQPFDLVCDPVEGQVFQLSAIDRLAWLGETVQDSNRVVVRMQPPSVRELLLSYEYNHTKDRSLCKLGLH